MISNQPFTNAPAQQGVSTAIMTHNMNDQRLDLDAIVALIPQHSSVLDLGCGDGSLLARLVAEKQVKARGVELDESNVRACIGRGLPVRQGNIEEGLEDYSDHTFEYVILSQTLAFLDRPRPVVQEMLRVGKRAIISFDNAGYWRSRWQTLWGVGCGDDLCNETARARAISLQEFHVFVDCLGAQIEGAAFVNHTHPVRWKPTLLARVAVFTIRSSTKI